MERRTETRIDTEQEVQVTVLSEPQMPVLQARAVDLSGRGLRLVLTDEIPAGAALKIQMADQMLLGEVAYCRDWGNEWHVGVEVQHSLVHTPDLERLRRSLIEWDTEGEPQMPSAGLRVSRR